MPTWKLHHRFVLWIISYFHSKSIQKEHIYKRKNTVLVPFLSLGWWNSTICRCAKRKCEDCQRVTWCWCKCQRTHEGKTCTKCILTYRCWSWSIICVLGSCHTCIYCRPEWSSYSTVGFIDRRRSARHKTHRWRHTIVDSCSNRTRSYLSSATTAWSECECGALWWSHTTV